MLVLLVLTCVVLGKLLLVLLVVIVLRVLTMFTSFMLMVSCVVVIAVGVFIPLHDIGVNMIDVTIVVIRIDGIGVVIVVRHLPRRHSRRPQH